jgi:hypothetical protein
MVIKMADVVDPNSRIADLIGLLYVLNNMFDGKADLYMLEKEMEVDLDELMPIVYTASMLGFVLFETGDLSITPLGKELIKSSIKTRKELIKKSLRNIEPFKTALSLGEFELDKLLETLQEKGVQTFNSPTGHHDVELTLIEWGIYSGLLGKDGDSFIVKS